LIIGKNGKRYSTVGFNCFALPEIRKGIELIGNWRLRQKAKAGILTILLVWTAFATPDEIRKIMEKPEKEIDVGRAVLILSKDAFPEIGIEQGCKLFDNMARGVQAIIDGSKDEVSTAHKRIGALNTFLYRPGPWNQAGPNKNMVFTYDESSVEHVQPKALFVPHMIYEQKGTCSTMPTLWYIIADRLGWPVNVVRGPGHLWVRYKGEKQGNIEATANGGFIPDSQYIKDMQISKEAIRKGVYMKPLTKKEFLATLMVNNAFYNVLSVEDSAKAIEYLEIAVKYDERNAEALSSLGHLTGNNEMIEKARDMGLTNHRYSQEFYEKRKKDLQKKGN